MSRPLPEDPFIRSLVVNAQRMTMTRRAVLGTGVGGAAALALAACAPGAGSTQPTLTPAADISDTDKNIIWANWPAYMDTDDDGNHPTLDAFTKATGIKVDYREDVDDNDTYYAKVKDQLALGQDIGADVTCLTDWMVSRWIRFGYTQKLDHSLIPNFKNLNPALLNIDYDPGRNNSLTWQSGFAGLAWNKDEFPNGFTSFSEMLAEPKLKGRIGVLSEMRDTMGVILLEQGVDISQPFTDDQFNTGIELLKENLSNGVIAKVKGNSYLDDLESKDTLAAIAWSGDITTANGEAGDHWEFALPVAGGTLWSDNFLIPIGAKHAKNVHQLINWYYDPEIAAELAAWVNYISPVVGAQDAMQKIDPSLVDNQLIFPSADTLSHAKIFRTLTPAEEASYSAAFKAAGLGA